MPLPYPLILRLLRPAAQRVAVYHATDGSGDLAETWRTSDGREWMVEAVCAGEAAQLYRPVGLVTAADVRRALASAPAVRR